VTPQTEPPTSTRDALLDAADRLLGRTGYRKTTLDDVALESGIGRRTIYLHFPSKEELFLSSIDRIVERLVAELERITEEPLAVPERLRRMLVARVMFRFDSVRGYYQSLDEMLASLRGAYLERRERYFAKEAKVLSRTVAEGVESGDFVAPDPLVCARTLVLATNSLLPYSLSPGELGSRRTIEKEAARLADLLLAGLGAGSRARARRA
jgi:AcrR family transcriptional regulator